MVVKEVLLPTFLSRKVGAGGKHMKIMVVGGGGREHTIIKKLKENKDVERIFALPGNGGIAADATCIPIGAKDIDGIVDFAPLSELEVL